MAFATWDALDRILDEIPHEGNRALVRSYLEERQANGIRLTTLTNDANHLRALTQFLGDRTLDEIAKEDIRRFVNRREGVRRWRSGETTTSRRTTIGVGTMNIRKIVIKAFVRWMRGTEDYPPEVKWLRQAREPDGDLLPASHILDRADLTAMVGAQDHPQAKAMIATLYDSGMRASEFCSLRLSDVTFDEYGAVLTLPKGGKGLKTGRRRVRVLNCTPYLRAWFNAHPFRKDPRAPLWLSLANRNKGAALTASALYGFVVRAGAAGALSKEVYPHLFRHSRATECAKEGWSEAEMRAYFGWAKGSDMPSHYVHMSGKDYEESMLRRAGKLDGGRRPEAALVPRVCQCGHENPFTADFCEFSACGRPLTPQAAERREAARLSMLLESVGEDPQALDRLAELVLRRATKAEPHPDTTRPLR